MIVVNLCFCLFNLILILFVYLMDFVNLFDNVHDFFRTIVKVIFHLVMVYLFNHLNYDVVKIILVVVFPDPNIDPVVDPFKILIIHNDYMIDFNLLDFCFYYNVLDVIYQISLILVNFFNDLNLLFDISFKILFRSSYLITDFIYIVNIFLNYLLSDWYSVVNLEIQILFNQFDNLC